MLAEFYFQNTILAPDEIQEIVDSLKNILPLFPRPMGLEQFVLDDNALYLSMSNV